MNLAFRIESYTIGGQIYISESTLAAAGPTMVEITGQQVVHPKGVQHPVTLYEVGGIGGPYNLHLDSTEELFLPLPIPIPLTYTVLSGKQVQDQQWWGQLVQLSAHGAVIQAQDSESTAILTSLSNLKLTLIPYEDSPNPDSTPISPDLYAKVMKTGPEPHRFCIYFTAKPPEVEIQLQTLYQLLRASASPPLV
jgi:adenylate cyclase